MEILNKTQFVERTKDIVHDYGGRYEITLIINAAVGLLFCGYEKRILPTGNVSSDMVRNYTSNYVNEKNDQITFPILARHIRNSIAHDCFEFKNINNRIEGIVFKDFNPNTNEKCEFEMSVMDFRSFVLSVAEKYIKDIQ